MPGPIYDRDYGTCASLLSELPYFVSALPILGAFAKPPRGKVIGDY
jgi:hypothetical protein